MGFPERDDFLENVLHFWTNITSKGDYLIMGGKSLGEEYEVKGENDVKVGSSILRTIEITGNRYLTSTHGSTTLTANLVTYQGGVRISSTPLSSGVSWDSEMYEIGHNGDHSLMRHLNVSSSGGAANISYNYAFNNYETTPNMYFPVSCTYTYDGETVRGFTVVEYGETHHIKVWRVLKDANGVSLKCPYAVLSEPCPTLFATAGHSGVISVWASFNTSLITNPTCPNHWLIEPDATTWPSAGNSTEGPIYRFADNNTDYSISNAVFNTTGTPTEYYDSTNKAMYYLMVQNNHVISETNTTPSSYTVLILPVTNVDWFIYYHGQFKPLYYTFTQEYFVAIRTNYEDKYDIPFRRMEFGDTQIWLGGDNYVNIEDAIDYIEIKGELGDHSSELIPRSTEQGTVYSGIHLFGLDIPWCQGEMHTFNANYHNWYGKLDFSGITTADVYWKNGYTTSYNTKCYILLDDNASYKY